MRRLLIHVAVLFFAFVQPCWNVHAARAFATVAGCSVVIGSPIYNANADRATATVSFARAFMFLFVRCVCHAQVNGTGVTRTKKANLLELDVLKSEQVCQL